MQRSRGTAHLRRNASFLQFKLHQFELMNIFVMQEWHEILTIWKKL